MVGVGVEMGNLRCVIDTFGNDAEEWQEAQMKYGELKEDLRRRISLSICPEGVIGKLNNRNVDIGGMLSSQDSKQSGIRRKPPLISE